MIGGSFRLLARVSLPLASILILAACGGSSQPKPPAARAVQGPGFRFSVPVGWTARSTARAVVAESGDDHVSVTVFPLLKVYAPARFAAAAKELDGIAARLAAAAGGSIGERATVVVDGRRTRAYRYEGGGRHIRIGFVLEGRSEYQLLCDEAGATDTDGACALLFDTFRVG
jgi:hypothetical protein